MCQRYGSLPEPGALLDQDAGLLARMALLGGVYDAVGHMRSLKGDAIRNMRADYSRLLVQIEKMGIRV